MIESFDETLFDEGYQGADPSSSGTPTPEAAQAAAAILKETIRIGGQDAPITDPEWKPISPLADSLGVSRASLKKAFRLLPRQPTIRIGLDAQNNQRFLYHRANALEALEAKNHRLEQFALSIGAAIIDDNGFYENTEGKWCTTDAFYGNLPPEVRAKTSEESIRRRATKTCKSLKAVDRYGRKNKCTIFLLSDLEKLSIILQERKVGPNGVYVDPDNDNEWASLATWEEIFRVTAKGLSKGIELSFGDSEKMSRLVVFNSGNREDKMFLRTEVEKALSYILEADELEINGVHTEITEVADKIRESIYLTAEELETIIPADRVPRYFYYRRLLKHVVDVVGRENGAPGRAISLNAAISRYHEKIADILSTMEKTGDNDEVNDAQDRYVTLSQFLNERRSANENVENRRKFIANTDQAKRIRRINSQNEITYLYLESDLKKAAIAA